MTVQISDEYIDKLIELFENIRDNQFEVGDTLVLLVDSSPDQRTEIMNYVAGKLAVSASTLYDYENTARRWTPEKRAEYASLDWTIYRNSDPEKDKELLDQAIDEGWNASTFKEKMFPALVEPSNQLARVVRILQKTLKDAEDVGYGLPANLIPELTVIIDRLNEMRIALEGEF